MGTVDMDNEAQRVRTLLEIEQIFSKAKLRVVNSADHPEELFASIPPVRVWVLCPMGEQTDDAMNLVKV